MNYRKGVLGGDEARSRLYDVMRSARPTAERLERALEIGTDYFGVDHGMVVEIDEGDDEWKAVVSTDGSHGELPVGTELKLSRTYCRRVVDERETLAVHDADAQGWGDDPVVTDTGAHCYHGRTVVVDDAMYGTVCFADTDPRSEPFSEAERAFTDLLAQMIGSELERERRQAELDRQETALERHQAELERQQTELRKRRELYRSVVESSFDVLFRIDTTGEFVYESPLVAELLGYEPGELTDTHFAELLPGEEAAEMGLNLFKRVLAGETVEEPYLPLEAKDGTVIYTDIRATPVYDTGSEAAPLAGDPLDAVAPSAGHGPSQQVGDSDIIAIQGMARDATDRKRREQLIGVLNRVLRHNLRNDMNVIQGYTSLLESEVDGVAADHVARISATATRLTELAETAQKLQDQVDRTLESTPVDLTAPIREAVAQVDQRADAATISVDLPEQAVARGAPRLEAALWELLENAVGHSGDAPSVEVSAAVKDGQVLVTVTDDGPGLPAAERAVIEEGEETPLDHGSGLGLWLVQWAVTSLDGEVTVDADADGTAITLSVPAADRQ